MKNLFFASTIFAAAIMALTKGSTNEDLKTLEYTKVPRPLFPLDEGFEYSDHTPILLKAKLK